MASTSTPTAAPAAGRSEFYAVTDVVDGDTVKLRIDGRIETIRAIGIDTPEVVDPRKPVQCFGQEASAHAKGMLTGKEVRVESDLSQGDRDQYSRLLRYIWLPDDAFFNEQMIAEGFDSLNGLGFRDLQCSANRPATRPPTDMRFSHPCGGPNTAR